MTSRILISPRLIHPHPLTIYLKRNNLPSVQDVFAPLEKAAPGAPVGLRMTVFLAGEYLSVCGAPDVLISRGAGTVPGQITAQEAIGNPAFEDALRLVTAAPQALRDAGERIDFRSMGWQISHPAVGVYMRDFWIFPNAALLLDNIHEYYAGNIEELTSLAITFFDPPLSRHAALIRAQEIDRLLHLMSPTAIPSCIGEWPEGVDKQELHFQTVRPRSLLKY